MLVREVAPNDFQLWTGGPSQLINDQMFSPDIERVWTPEELAEKGLYVPVFPAIPDGKVVVGTVFMRDGDTVTAVYTLEDTPIPDLTMRQLRLGLVAAGFPGSYIQSLIDGLPEPDKTVAQIWYEETSSVQWAHPMTQTLMGLTAIPEEQREAMWLAASQIPA